MKPIIHFALSNVKEAGGKIFLFFCLTILYLFLPYLYMASLLSLNHINIYNISTCFLWIQIENCLSTWPAECIELSCLLPGSQRAPESLLDWIRCSRIPQAGTPCWPLAALLPPPTVYKQRSWPLCLEWPSPDTLQPLGEVKWTSCTENRLSLYPVLRSCIANKHVKLTMVDH